MPEHAGIPIFKTCAKCGFKNAVQKNYCDQCGSLFEAGHNLPPAGRLAPLGSSSTPAPPSTPPTSPRGAKRKARIDRWKELAYSIRSTVSLIFLIVLGIGLFYAGMDYWDIYTPPKAVPRMARSYLAYLSSGDYATAYYSLSRGARAHCTMDQFRLHQGTQSWTWSALSLVKTEPDLMMLEYSLKRRGGEPVRNFLTFNLEEDGWAIPFNDHIVARVEDWIKRGDIDMALIDAQEAVAVNPRDPVARAYFCQASYRHKLAAQAKQECAIAFKLHQDYPSNISPETWRSIRALAEQTK